MRAYNASNNVVSNRDSARQSAKGKLRKMGQYNSDVLNKSTERQRLKSQPNNLVTSQGAAALRALNARRSEAAQKRSYECKGLNPDCWAWWRIPKIGNWRIHYAPKAFKVIPRRRKSIRRTPRSHANEPLPCVCPRSSFGARDSF